MTLVRICTLFPAGFPVFSDPLAAMLIKFFRSFSSFAAVDHKRSAYSLRMISIPDSRLPS